MARSKRATAEEIDRFAAEIEIFDTSDMVELSTLNVGASFTFKRRKYTIENKEECPRQWRSHVHVNKSNCFDGRTLVRTV